MTKRKEVKPKSEYYLNKDGEKKCTRCKEVKPKSEYYLNNNGKNGLFSLCKKCCANGRRKWRKGNMEAWREARKRWIKNNPDKRKIINKRAVLKRTYGIALEDYDKTIKMQDGECPICHKEPRRFFVDHDHLSNQVRGLICTKCNTILGMANDNIDILLSAIQYLIKFENKGGGQHGLVYR